MSAGRFRGAMSEGRKDRKDPGPLLRVWECVSVLCEVGTKRRSWRSPKQAIKPPLATGNEPGCGWDFGRLRERGLLWRRIWL